MSSTIPVSTFLQLISSCSGFSSLLTWTESARARDCRSRSRLACTFSRDRYSPPALWGTSFISSAIAVPSRTVTLMCISLLPRSLAIESAKVLLLFRIAWRKASSDSNTVPNLNGSNVAILKHSLTIRACSMADCWFRGWPCSISLTITTNSPHGKPRTGLAFTPLRDSIRNGRRTRPCWKFACSLMQYAYHAIFALQRLPCKSHSGESGPAQHSVGTSEKCFGGGDPLCHVLLLARMP